MPRKKIQCSLSSIQKKALSILEKHGVKRASIFGSFARGTAFDLLENPRADSCRANNNFVKKDPEIFLILSSSQT